MDKAKSKRVRDVIAVLFANIIALGLALIPYPFMVQAGIHPLFAALISDVTATVLVYLFGLILKTPSTYDPYWSLQTIALFLMISIYHQNFTWHTLLVFIPLLYYSLRLTIHFFGTFHGLDYVDWRYQNFKDHYPKVFQLISLFGIHMFPTFVVYVASLPILIYGYAGGFSPFAIAYAVTACGAVTLAMIADLQMKKARKNRKDRSQVMMDGLWGYSRHPNYLGEISFWFCALFLIGVFPNYWWVFFGPIIVLLLFVFYSIPAIEKQMAMHKPSFNEYQRRVSPLLILPRKKEAEPESKPEE